MFNKETEYALRGLVYIQVQNMKKQNPGIDEISKAIDAPRHYIAKILQRMAKNGFVESMKGKGGGFYFDKKKEDLVLSKIIFAIEGAKSFSGCGFGLKQCDDKSPCPLHDKFGPIREAMSKLVTEETIQGLARKTYNKKQIRLNLLK